MKIKKTTFINILLFVVGIVLTLWLIFKNQDLYEIYNNIKNANWIFWIFGVVLVVVFILTEAHIIKELLANLGYKVPMRKTALYSFVGYFFSCITPSASGGQPAQLIFMKRNNIPASVSTLVLLLVTLAYKGALIVYGLIFVLCPRQIYHNEALLPWVYLGIILNVIVVIFMLILAFSSRAAEKIVMFFSRMLVKITKSDKLAAYHERLGRTMENYSQLSQYMKGHKKLLLRVFLITFAQRGLLFIITYFVCLSFGLYRSNPIDILMIQSGIYVAVDMLPLPGGMGISEHLFLIGFREIASSRLLVPIMVVSRGLSYYTQLIISAIFTGAAYLMMFVRKEK